MMSFWIYISIISFAFPDWISPIIGSKTAAKAKLTNSTSSSIRSVTNTAHSTLASNIDVVSHPSPQTSNTWSSLREAIRTSLKYKSHCVNITAWVSSDVEFQHFTFGFNSWNQKWNVVLSDMLFPTLKPWILKIMVISMTRVQISLVSFQWLS